MRAQHGISEIDPKGTTARWDCLLRASAYSVPSPEETGNKFFHPLVRMGFEHTSKNPLDFLLD
jgi:hypothetical protein